MKLVSTNPMTKVLMAILAFQALCCGLAIPGMIQIGNVPVGPAFAFGGVAALLSLVAAGTLRRDFGWILAWVAQVAGIALGFAVELMFFVGGMFALLFVMTFVLGKRLEAARAAG